MNKLMIFFLLGSLSTGLLAQEREITGSVREADGRPLPGATIINKKKNTGVTTNENGIFAMNADINDTIIVSYIGYVTEEVTPGNDAHIEVTLIPDITNLDEVVVTALGISRDVKSLGVARQSVSTEDITEARDPNLVNSLAGKVAGLQVISNGGPTSSTAVIIRGNSSLTGNNQPIWVIDGVPVINKMGTTDEDIDYGNDVAGLSPDMIESIEVLKGPNAAALYGSIAQNGAILITSKKGTTTDRLGVSFNSNVMFHQVREYPDYQNIYGAGHLLQTGRDEADRQDSTGYPFLNNYFRSWGGPMIGQKVINYNGEVTTYDPSPDNVKEYYQVGKVFTNTLTLDRSYEAGSFRFSYSNINGSDIVPNHDVQKINSFTLRAVKELSPFVKVDASAMWSHEKVNNRIYKNWNPRNPMNTFIYMTRNMSVDDLTPWKQPDGTAFGSFDGDQFDNPMWVLNEIENEDSKDRLIGDVTIYGTILKNFNYRAKISHDFIQREGYEFNNWGADYDPDGSYSNFMLKNSQTNYEALITYSSKLKDIFTYTFNLGVNQRDYSYLRRWAGISSLILPDMKSIYNSEVSPTSDEDRITTRTQSVFSFANFGYRDVVFLDLTYRGDWSSTLPANNNNYWYPSVSTSILYSKIFKIRQDLLPFGKIRFSWARVGNDASAYQTANVLEYGGQYNNTPWVYINTTRKNEELKPESTTAFEVGFDNRFINNRLSFDLTLYSQSTKNQIVDAAVSKASGYSEKVFNAGQIDNKGIELSLGGKPIQSGKFEWEIFLNWSKNYNEVVSLSDSLERYLLGSLIFVNIYAETGQPYGVIRGNTLMRAEDGKPILNPTNNEPYYVEDGYMGNAFPDWLGSVRNNIRFKNFDIGILVDFMKGGEFYSLGNHKAQVWGNTVQSLEGREEWYFSSWILGETDEERFGRGIDGTTYADIERNKGIYVEGYHPLADEETGRLVVDEEGNYVAGEAASAYILPQIWWQGADFHMEMNTFDRSFIKLREVTLGYTFPKSFLKNLPVRKIKISAVGRNLWTIFKNTPQGIDPEATLSVGNAQGVEFGSTLPTVYYGFDLKVTF